MATIAPASDQAADLLQNLSLDSQSKTTEVPEATKKPPAIQRGPIGAGGADGPIQPHARYPNSLLQDFTDPTMSYHPNGYPSAAYYYGGYDGSINEWNEYPRYVNSEGVEMPPGVYGDHGSLMYHHGYGFPPYGGYSPVGSPVPTMGHDGQLYGPQHYQYSTLYQPPTPSGGPYTPNQAPAAQGDISTSVSSDKVPLSVEVANGNAGRSVNGTNNGSMPLRQGHHNSPLNSNGSYGRGGVLAGGIPSGYQDPRFGFDGMWSPVPWLDGLALTDGQHRPATSSVFSSQPRRNQSLRPLPHLMGLQSPRSTPGIGTTPGFTNRMYPNNKYNQYGATARTGGGFGSNGYDSWTNGRLAVDSKYKPRGRGNSFSGYGNENMDGLNELNRGPRAGGFKNQNIFSPITLAVKGQNISLNSSEDKDNSNVIRDSELYNRADFTENYSDAKCFIIKSYSEDDVHKSIKYNVWASTPNGNKKLDAGYREAQEKSGDCPVFLFFSVNTSGQFVGLSEMVGPVDFNKNVEYWQQDKWNGCFPVKWHIVKDVPNSLLKHITLENNDNKPVTNSRDTQEVKFEQGIQLLKIFKEHSSKTSILDDFGFYETRQKTIQEQRAKQQQFQKQVWDGISTDTVISEENGKEETIGKLGSKKSVEITSDLFKEPSAAQVSGENRQSEEN